MCTFKISIDIGMYVVKLIYNIYSYIFHILLLTYINVNAFQVWYMFMVYEYMYMKKKIKNKTISLKVTQPRSDLYQFSTKGTLSSLKIKPLN